MTENEPESPDETSNENEVNELDEIPPAAGKKDASSPGDNVVRVGENEDIFLDHDPTNPRDVADVLREIEPNAAVTVEELIHEKNRLEAEADHYQEQYEKVRRDFNQYKQRKESETEQIKDRGLSEFLQELLPVRDNLERALTEETENIKSGVELTAQEFDDLLEQHGVSIIDPNPGDDVNPERHKVMTRVSSDVDEGQIDGCHRPGYSLNGQIVRTARVTVSDG